ncbi:hypothetical protein Tco_1275444 [Tanacetum coccineum]
MSRRRIHKNFHADDLVLETLSISQHSFSRKTLFWIAVEVEVVFLILEDVVAKERYKEGRSYELRPEMRRCSSSGGPFNGGNYRHCTNKKVNVVKGVLPSGVDMLLEKDLVRFALQRMKIHPLMASNSSMILQTIHLPSTTPIRDLLVANYVEMTLNTLILSPWFPSLVKDPGTELQSKL